MIEYGFVMFLVLWDFIYFGSIVERRGRACRGRLLVKP